MRDSGCDWCETEVGVSGVGEGEVSDGSKGRVGHGLLHKYVSNVVVKRIRESDTLNCLGTCWRFHGLEDLLLAAHPGKEGMGYRGCHKWLELETWVFGHWYSFNWLFKSYTHLELDCFPGTALEMDCLSLIIYQQPLEIFCWEAESRLRGKGYCTN